MGALALPPPGQQPPPGQPRRARGLPPISEAGESTGEGGRPPGPRGPGRGQGRGPGPPSRGPAEARPLDRLPTLLNQPGPHNTDTVPGAAQPPTDLDREMAGQHTRDEGAQQLVTRNAAGTQPLNLPPPAPAGNCYTVTTLVGKASFCATSLLTQIFFNVPACVSIEDCLPEVVRRPLHDLERYGWTLRELDPCSHTNRRNLCQLGTNLERLAYSVWRFIRNTPCRRHIAPYNLGDLVVANLISGQMWGTDLRQSALNCIFLTPATNSLLIRWAATVTGYESALWGLEPCRSQQTHAGSHRDWPSGPDPNPEDQHPGAADPPED